MSTMQTINPPSALRRQASARWLTFLLEMLRRIEAMAERRRSRRVLYGLNEEQLKDIGLSRSDAYREASRPFWQ